ncbi:hypothetical protein HZB06_00550 [Candidatus Wolfebacteria bacterium]|nr:hypothetical protein [Candidatus Wolfebacteria bacterium]
MEKVGIFVIFAAILVVTGIVFFASMEGAERADCRRWQQQAKDAPNVFFLLPWQKAQCDYWSIKVDAPVRGGGR